MNTRIRHRFFRAAIAEIASLSTPTQMKAMEFGCGSGELVQCLPMLGYEAYGCDIESYRQRNAELIERFEKISLLPYRLPFASETLDVVVSTSVLEDAHNKE